MSDYTSPLIVSPTEKGDWILVQPFTYHVGAKDSGYTITVPAGFETDFASVPKIFWFLPAWAWIHKAAILHDWLYKCKELFGEPVSRAMVDLIYLEAALVDWRNHRSRWIMAHSQYWAVRLFGWLAWRRV